MSKRQRRRSKPHTKGDRGQTRDRTTAPAKGSPSATNARERNQSESLASTGNPQPPDATRHGETESWRMFKADDGVVDKIAKCVDVVVKVSLIVAAVIAVWKIYLFQETTQIISTSIETTPLASEDRTYVEVTLKVTNTGKVRVTLVAGMLRLKSMESNDRLTFRVKESDDFSDEVIIPNVFIVDATKADYPQDIKTATRQPDYLQAGNLFFDPGETIKMRFLIEYDGSGLCNVVTRYDGSQIGSLWFEEEYEILGASKAKGLLRLLE